MSRRTIPKTVGRRTSSACWTFMTRSTSMSWWRSTRDTVVVGWIPAPTTSSALRNRREAGRLRLRSLVAIGGADSHFEHHSLGAGVHATSTGREIPPRFNSGVLTVPRPLLRAVPARFG